MPNERDYDKWRGLDCRLLWAYEGPVPRAGNGRQGVMNGYFAWLLLEGEAEFSFYGREKGSLRAGEWGIPPPGATERFHRFSEGARLLSLYFRLEWPGGRHLHPLKRFVSFPAARYSGFTESARLLVELCRGHMDYPLNQDIVAMDFAEHARTQEVFWRCLAAWSEALNAEGVPAVYPDALDERLIKMLEVLDGVEGHGPVPYEALEKASSLGRVQIDRLFKRHLGCTPKRIRENKAVEFCKRRLLSSRVSAKELSEEMGFSHPADFNAWFARLAGIPPQRFRERGLMH